MESLMALLLLDYILWMTQGFLGGVEVVAEQGLVKDFCP